jgi:hypothetical protein
MIRRFVLISLLLTLSGCSKGTEDGGAPAPLRMLQPFQGEWQFSQPKTLARWRATGMPANNIKQVEKLAEVIPIHPGMVVKDNIAVLLGVVEGEYYFFALHPHGRWVCGKAWHHEDRHDPGDMSKCLVRLELRNSDLWLSLRDNEDWTDVSDPDIVDRPLTAGSAESCEADAAATPPCGPWQTFIFERARGSGEQPRAAAARLPRHMAVSIGSRRIPVRKI